MLLNPMVIYLNLCKNFRMQHLQFCAEFYLFCDILKFLMKKAERKLIRKTVTNIYPSLVIYHCNVKIKTLEINY